MDRLFDWRKRYQRHVTLMKSLFLALLPIACCLIYCAAQGRRLSDVYLPSSEWNDELFYYKQVESIVNYGYPLGYFGFNESRALKLSFAAWSPILVFPWVIWGLLFGWNLLSPILCNILLMTLCCFLFAWLVKPTWKQIGILTLLFCLYTPFVRYMLSGMPEVICFSMLISFYSLAISYLRGTEGKKRYKLLGLAALSSVMTLMRPYLALSALLPAWLWIRRGASQSCQWKRAAGALVWLATTLGLYACIKHYLGAEYFAPLFFTDWISAFPERGILGGIQYMLGKLHYMGKDFLAYMQQGFRTGLASGTFFAGYLACMAILAAQSIRDWQILRQLRSHNPARKRTSHESTVSSNLLIETHLLFSFIAMFFALLLMYKLTEGSKHLLTFISAAIFVVSLMETRFYKKAVLLGITFAYLYSYKAVDPYDYQVPFAQEEQASAVAQWETVFTRELALTREQTPSYENVVIWVFSDTVEGTMVNTQWQMLYALPKGFGISCCMPDYVMDNFDSLQSKYLYVQRGGPIEAKCIASQFRKIAEDTHTVLFQIRVPDNSPYGNEE